MWSQWCFSLHLTGTFGAFREYENVLSCKIVQKKMQMLSKTYAWNVRMCAKEFYVQFSVLKCSLLMFCWRKGENPPFILMLFSSHVALSVFYPSLSWSEMDKSADGRRWQFMCTCLLKDIQKCVCLFFHSICKIYLPYSGFYCVCE